MAFSFLFPKQKGHIVARAIRSPVSTTQRYERSSSSFSAGCANTLTAVRTSASNSTTNGASGCRKPRKHTTRSVRTKRTSFCNTHQDGKSSLLAHMKYRLCEKTLCGFMWPTKKENQNIRLFFWSIDSHLIAFTNGKTSYNLQTVTTTDGNGQSK